MVVFFPFLEISFFHGLQYFHTVFCQELRLCIIFIFWRIWFYAFCLSFKLNFGIGEKSLSNAPWHQTAVAPREWGWRGGSPGMGGWAALGTHMLTTFNYTQLYLWTFSAWAVWGLKRSKPRFCSSSFWLFWLFLGLLLMWENSFISETLWFSI